VFSTCRQTLAKIKLSRNDPNNDVGADHFTTLSSANPSAKPMFQIYFQIPSVQPALNVVFLRQPFGVFLQPNLAPLSFGNNLSEFLNGGGNPSKGASAKFIASLPTIRLAKDCGDEMCSVCQDKLTAEEDVTQLPCNHQYHKDCIEPWLQSNHTCPVCRAELPTKDEDTVEYLPTAASPSDDNLSIGDVVRLSGLSGRPELNGLVGQVVGDCVPDSRHSMTVRYPVSVCGRRTVFLVKSSNCEIVGNKRPATLFREDSTLAAQQRPKRSRRTED
jgi:E3 ubiquitin-protein ligase RNF115/126